MGTQATNPSQSAGGKALKIQRSVYDLKTMDTIKLVKEFVPPVAESPESALEMLGGDSAKLLDVINKGLAAAKRQELNSSQEGWFHLDDEGEVGEPYSGTFGDQADVQMLIRSIAISACGYDPKGTPEEKKAARKEAIDLIRETPRLTAKLVAQSSKASE